MSRSLTVHLSSKKEANSVVFRPVPPAREIDLFAAGAVATQTRTVPLVLRHQTSMSQADADFHEMRAANCGSKL